ncbi:MAG: Hsp70 family protein [Actinomycetota bacterium]|nr:Hsp70 family protein [Actinomycetota bacterium]
MSRATIDFGIDLGTTNSEIAVMQAGRPAILKNNEGMDFTPSAVWLDRRGSLIVGRQAKERVEEDPNNAFAEFKLQMGTPHTYSFSRDGHTMRPEELSAEVLKSLRENVRQGLGEEIEAAVITVPAAFDLAQNEATRQAAKLAGIRHAPLLQEPVAAALAYGLRAEATRAMWLVFDLGGGTFDAAVMSVREGTLQVVNHRGDNNLGGKLIDWSIVEEILIPALASQYSFPDLRRGNKKWGRVLAKLKGQAKEAKINLSTAQEAVVTLDNVPDASGKIVEFDFVLTRELVEKVAMPYFLRAVGVARTALADKRLGPADIERVLLVGGPTRTPLLRQMLEDPVSGLGIPIDFSQDPLTVVAQGAAIFASGQRVEAASRATVRHGQNVVELDYKPVGSDPEPFIGGRVLPSGGEDLAGFTIEFVNTTAQLPWRSGQVPLGPEGSFMTNLWAVKGPQNIFSIELVDTRGTKRGTLPREVGYTIGLTISEAPLTHSIGVGMANNHLHVFFRRGDPLPARKMQVHRLIHAVGRGRADQELRIPFYEGENLTRSDLNTPIGNIVLSGADARLTRDLPVDTEVEITLEIDVSRIAKGKAFIPLIDEELTEVFKVEKSEPRVDDLTRRWDREQARLVRTTKRAAELGSQEVRHILKRIEDERFVAEIQHSIDAAATDEDAAQKCEARLHQLSALLYEAEDLMEWPQLVVQANAEISAVEQVVSEYGDQREKGLVRTLVAETRQAIEHRSPEELRTRTEKLTGLRFAVLGRQPAFWVGYLDFLENEQGSIPDQRAAAQLLAQGRKAINDNDLTGLQAAVRQLSNLLPADKQEEARVSFGTTMKA